MSIQQSTPGSMLTAPPVLVSALTGQSTADTQDLVLSVLVGSRNGRPTHRIPDPGATFERIVQPPRVAAGPGSKCAPAPLGPSGTRAFSNKLLRIRQYSQRAQAPTPRFECLSASVGLLRLVPASPRAGVDTLGSIQPAKIAENLRFEHQDYLSPRHPLKFRQPTRQIGPIMEG